MIKIVLAYFLLSSQAFGGLPPTTMRGQSQTSKPTVFNFQAPYNQATITGAATALIETDYNNLLVNPSFEALVSTDGWTFGAGVSPTLDTSNVYSGKQAVSMALTAVNGLVMSQDVTPTIQIAGQPMEQGIRVKTSATTVQVCARQAGATVGNCNQIVGNNTWQYLPLNLSGPASGSVGVSVFTTGSTTGTVVVETAYVGYARNIISTNTSVSGGFYSPTTFTQGTYGFTTYSTVTGSFYSGKTFTGNLCVDSGTANNYEMTCTLPAGSYHLSAAMVSRTDASSTCSVRIYDGASEIGSNFMVAVNGASAGNVEGNITYTTPVTKTFSVQMIRTGGTACYHGGGSATGSFFQPSMTITQIGSTAGTALAANTPSSPTIQTFTSGSGTYTRPNGVTYIKVRMVGAGGGGGGSGTAGGGTGGTGGNTTFGTSLLAANGGVGGVGTAGMGGTGGTSSLGTGPQGTALSGGSGQGASGSSGIGTAAFVGGMGASTPFAGGGAGAGFGMSGGSAVTNSGAGGGGAAGPASQNSGAGGGAGGYVEALISNPSSTYSYAVGAAGTAGTAGTSGFTGGAGGSGYIEVTEYYGAQNVPLLIGSVISPSSGVEKITRAKIGNNGTCSIISQSGSWVSSVSRPGGGQCALAITGFSAAPTCTVTGTGSYNNQVCETFTPTTTSIAVGCYAGSTAALTDGNFDLICIGPQ